MRAVILAAIASMALVGCVGELNTMPGDPGGDDDQPMQPGSEKAKAAYTQNVHPIMKAKCVGCHSVAGPVGNISGFVDDNKPWETATSFQSFVGAFTPNTAPVLLKIQAGHQGVAYSSDDTNKITDWLNEEVLWRNGGGGTTMPPPNGESPAQATQRVLAAWSGCMTKTNFDTANMAGAWGNMTANNNQRCSNCHASGDGGFMATVDSQLFFDVVSSNKYYLLQYFTVKLDLTNLANSTVEINTKSFLGVSTGQDPHREHPRFNATTNNGMTALNTFYNSTMMALTTAGTAGCGPSKLTN